MGRVWLDARSARQRINRHSGPETKNLSAHICPVTDYVIPTQVGIQRRWLHSQR